MSSIWETSVKIRAFDIDSSDRLKVGTIFDYFQDAASYDAERLNFGYKDFVPIGLLWVLSWMKIECIKYPKFMDEVKVQTWGKKQYKLYSMRDYLMINSNKEIICKGTSGWLLLDAKTLRPKILTELFPDLRMLDSKDALTDLPQKIKSSKQLEVIYSSQIRYSDIDLNQHTNNAKYIEQILDCYEENFHKNNSLKSLTISFNSETKYGDQLDLYRESDTKDSSTHYIEAKNRNSGRSVFQALVEWN